MRRLGITAIALLILLFCFSASGFSQTNIPMLGIEYGVGVRALGMGGAFTGIADDYSASYWNPAGLGQMRRMELTAGFNSLAYKSNTTYYGNLSGSSRNYTGLNSVGYVYPVPTYKGSMVFSVGYNKAANYSSTFLIQGFNDSSQDSVYQSGEQLDRGGLNQWVIAGAVQLSEQLYLGGAVNFWTGKYNYTWTLNEYDDYDLYEQSQWQVLDDINTKITGFNVKFGILYNLFNRIRFGAAIETPVTFSGKEDWTRYDKTSYDDNTYWDSTATGDYKYKIQKPLTMSAGASLVLPLITVSGSVEYADWSQLEYKTPAELKTENRNFMRNLQPTLNYRLGAELKLPLVGTRFRAGYILAPNPDRTVTGGDKNFITAGVGFLLDRQFMIDLAVVHGWWNNNSGGNYTEEIKTFNYFASASFRF